MRDAIRLQLTFNFLSFHHLNIKAKEGCIQYCLRKFLNFITLSGTECCGNLSKTASFELKKKKLRGFKVLQFYFNILLFVEKIKNTKKNKIIYPYVQIT